MHTTRILFKFHGNLIETSCFMEEKINILSNMERKTNTLKALTPFAVDRDVLEQQKARAERKKKARELAKRDMI